MVIGMLLGLAVSPNVDWINYLLNFFGQLSINILLYTSSIYIVLKVFIGFYELKKQNKSKKFIPVFIISIVFSMFFSIALSMLLMNINKMEFRVFQIKYPPVEVNSFESIVNTIINTNILGSFVGPTRYLSPLIFIGVILGVTSLFANKKMELFIEVVLSFEQFVDKITRAIMEIFPVFATFMIAYLFNTGFLNANFTDVIRGEQIGFRSIGKTLFVIIFTATILILMLLLVYKLAARKSIRMDLLGILGSGLIAFTTANTITTVIPLSEQLERNAGVNAGFAKVLTPICILFNKTGTVMVSVISILTILNTYHINKVAVSLQLIIGLLVFVFSFRLDGSNGMGFLVLVAMILQFKPLKLEENSYLLFMIFLPLLNRIAIFVDTITSALIILIASKAAKLKTEVKYIDTI